MRLPHLLLQCISGTRTSVTLLSIALALCLFGGRAVAAADSAPSDAAVVFYVSTAGRDNWSGTLAEPNAAKTDGPFATIARARDAVRELKSKSKEKSTVPVKVLVRGGKYRLNETLVFTADDSGTAESLVTYAAYPGENPILSGGRTITGWKPYKDKNVQASVPEAKTGRWNFRQLFCDGQRQTRARYPNADPNDPWRGGWLPVKGAAEPGSFTAFEYAADSFPRHWAKPTQGAVFIIIKWGYTVLSPIKSFDEQRHAITMARSVRNFAVPPWVLPNAPPGMAENFHTVFGHAISYSFFVENLLEELDQPGEWCLDTDEGKVYFRPPQSPIEQHEISAPVLDRLVDLRGASWLTLSGFTFTETVNGGDNMHPTGYQGYGAMFPMDDGTYCGEAVHLQNAEHCSIVDNIFTAVGGNAIYLEGYNLKNVIQGNEIAYAGHCGVGLMGKRDRQDNNPQHPVYNQITDNHIHHCGVFDRVAPGVFCGLSDGNVIGHNLIEQMPHHAINMGNHGYGRNIVEYNDIRHVCQQTYDTAAVNSWMENDRVEKEEDRAGHIFRFNRIADVPGELSFGLYLDNFTSNCLVYGNIILRCGQSGIRINGGKNNVVENNILIGGQKAIGFWSAICIWPHMKGYMAGNRFERNIASGIPGKKMSMILEIDTDSHPEDVSRVLGSSDFNLFSSVPGITEEVKTGPQTMSLAQWRREGYDEHSLVADPMFVDPEHDDYRLKPESPALKLGFRPIDASQIGPRKRPSAP